jgi:hypothetical protein
MGSNPGLCMARVDCTFYNVFASLVTRDGYLAACEGLVMASHFYNPSMRTYARFHSPVLQKARGIADRLLNGAMQQGVGIDVRSTFCLLALQ